MVKSATPIYNTLLKKVKNEKFYTWIKNYKKENHISYKIEGNVLPYVEKFYSILATDTAKVEKFINELGVYVYPSQGTISMSIDPRLLALYELALEEYKNDLLHQNMASGSYYNDISNEIKQVLTTLYKIAPYSEETLTKLYKIDPSNEKIALRYFQYKYNLIEPLISNQQMFKMYLSQLTPYLSYIKNGLGRIERTATSTNLKKGALVILISIAKKIGNLKEELKYLKKLKTVDPSYDGINKLIKQVEKLNIYEELNEPTAESALEIYSSISGKYKK